MNGKAPDCSGCFRNPHGADDAIALPTRFEGVGDMLVGSLARGSRSLAVVRSRARLVAAAATLLSTGCTYLHQRARDFADIFTATVESGSFGVQTQLGPIFPGLYVTPGESDSKYGVGSGLIGGQVTDYHFDQSSWLLWGDAEFHGFDDDTRAKESGVGQILLVPFPMDEREKGLRIVGDRLYFANDPVFSNREVAWSHPKRWAPRFGQVEVALACGKGVRLGVNFAEAADFLLGWFGLDLLGDDPPWFPPDLHPILPNSIGETATGAVPEGDPGHPLARAFPGAFEANWSGWYVRDRKLGVCLSKLSWDRASRRLINRFEISCFGDPSGRFEDRRCTVDTFEDTPPYSLMQHDIDLRRVRDEVRITDSWGDSGGFRKSLVAGKVLQQKIESRRPCLQLHEFIPIGISLSGLHPGVVIDQVNEYGETHRIEIEGSGVEAADAAAKLRYRVIDPSSPGLVYSYSYGADGRRDSIEIAGISIRSEAAPTALTLDSRPDSSSVIDSKLTGLSEASGVLTSIELEWPGATQLVPTTDLQRSEWIDEGRLQRVTASRARPPTTEEVDALVDDASFKEELADTVEIPSGHSFIRRIAAEHRGASDDPWVITTTMTRFVESYVRGDDSKRFSALSVAKFPRGDCTAHASLLAALLRAQHIPARVVSGCVKSPFGNDIHGHAWIEAWIGRWIPIDPTFGQAPADVFHIRCDVGSSTLMVNAFPFGAPVRVIRQLEE